MRIDFFEFVEGVFRGLVFFLYNFVETLWLLLRRPFRGPVILFRNAVRPDRKQMEGVTALFFVFLISYAFGWTDGRELEKLLNEPPALDGDALWVPFVGALISTVAIDAPLRLLMRSRWRDCPRKARMQLAIVEFAAIWPFLALTTPRYLFEALVSWPRTPEMRAILKPVFEVSWEQYPVIRSLAFWGSLVLAVIAAAPMAAWWRMSIDYPGEAVRRRKRSLSGTPVQLLCMGFIGLSLYLGLSAVAEVEDTRKRAAYGAGSPKLLLVGFACTWQGPTAHADVALFNVNARPMVLNPESDFTVQLYSRTPAGAESFRTLPIVGVDGGPVRLVVVPHGQTQLFRVNLDNRGTSRVRDFIDCKLERGKGVFRIEQERDPWLGALYGMPM